MNLLKGVLSRADGKPCVNGNNIYQLTIGTERASTFDAACLKDVGKEVCVPFKFDKTGRFKNVDKWVQAVDTGAPSSPAPAAAAPASGGGKWGDSPEKNASVFTKYGIDMATAFVQTAAGEEQRKLYVNPEQFASLCAWYADQALETYRGLVEKQKAKT